MNEITTGPSNLLTVAPAGNLGGASMGQGVVRGVIPNWRPGATPNLAISQVSPTTLAQANDTFERQVTVAGLSEPVRVTFGPDTIGAQVTRGVVGSGGALLLICIWGRGPVNAIGSITMNNAALPTGVTATNYLGTTSQTVDGSLVTAFALLGITHTDALLGIAYSVISFPVGTDIGDIRATINGVPLYDLRNGAHVLATPSTWTYADGPALALAQAIYNPTYGLGATISDWSTVSAVANANDALVGGEKKRILGITMDRRLPAEQWIDIFRAHAGCYVLRQGSGYKLVPEAIASSVRTFTNDDIIKGSLKWRLNGLSEQSNVVQVAYTNTTTTPWSTAYVSYPNNGQPAVSTEALRLTRLDLSGVQRYSQAERECIEYGNHNNLESLNISFETFADAIALEAGQVYTVNDSGLFAGITLRCVRVVMVKAGRYRIEGKKYDPAAFSSIANAAPTSGNTTLPTPANPPTVGALTLTEEYVTQPAGALPLSRIRGTWTALSTYPFLVGYRVIAKDVNGVTVDDQTIGTAAVYISPPLVALTTYTVYVYARSAVAQSATASSGSVTLTGTGIESLAVVSSQAITPAGSWFIDGPVAYTLYPGDPVMRLRRDNSATMAAVYAGADMSTPGRGSMILDAYRDGPATLWTYSDSVISPVYDLGASRSGVFAVLNVQDWAALYSDALTCEIWASSSPSMTSPVITTGWRAIVSSKRYMLFWLKTKEDKATGSNVYRRFWAIEFASATASLLMPTVTDNFTATSSAAGPITVQLPRRYITANAPQVSATYAGTANPNASGLTTSETVLEGNFLTLQCTDQAGAFIAAPCSITLTGVAA